jgi:hypothetical protein
LVVSARDGGVRGYQSHEQVNGDMQSRSLTMSDETYTSYRESSRGGFGDTYERPPGRLYLVDPQVFVLFDVICRDMHAQTFDERSITMIYITSKDTAVDGRVKRLGKVPFKLGKRTVMAEKLSITDPWSEFFAWVSPSGRMLRLTLPELGLRVERDPASLEPGKEIKRMPMAPVGVPDVLVTEDAKPAPKAGSKARSDSLPPPSR